MAALLLVSRSASRRRSATSALTFALAYGVVRVAHIGLFVLASRDDPDLRRSVVGLAISTAIGVGLLVVGVAARRRRRRARSGRWRSPSTWAARTCSASEGWKLVPGHFAERHGLIIIIALGESIVAIGVGAGGRRSTSAMGVAAVLGIGARRRALVAVLRRRRARRRRAGSSAPRSGREQNEIARDSYSYLHFPMVAGIVLVALGLKKTLGHVDDPLEIVPAFALLGGIAVYLLGPRRLPLPPRPHVNLQRTVLAVLLVAPLPAGDRDPRAGDGRSTSPCSPGRLIVYETRSYGDRRGQVRHDDYAHDDAAAPAEI